MTKPQLWIVWVDGPPPPGPESGPTIRGPTPIWFGQLEAARKWFEESPHPCILFEAIDRKESA